MTGYLGCGDFSHVLMRLSGKAEFDDISLVTAEINSIDRVSKMATLTYDTGYLASAEIVDRFPTSGVMFFYHCEYSEGDQVDSENGHLAFLPGELVVVMYHPNFDGLGNPATFIVGHADRPDIVPCHEELLYIALDIPGSDDPIVTVYSTRLRRTIIPANSEGEPLGWTFPCVLSIARKAWLRSYFFLAFEEANPPKWTDEFDQDDTDEFPWLIENITKQAYSGYNYYTVGHPTDDTELGYYPSGEPPCDAWYQGGYYWGYDHGDTVYTPTTTSNVNLAGITRVPYYSSVTYSHGLTGVDELTGTPVDDSIKWGKSFGGWVASGVYHQEMGYKHIASYLQESVYLGSKAYVRKSDSVVDAVCSVSTLEHTFLDDDMTEPSIISHMESSGSVLDDSSCPTKIVDDYASETIDKSSKIIYTIDSDLNNSVASVELYKGRVVAEAEAEGSFYWHSYKGRSNPIDISGNSETFSGPLRGVTNPHDHYTASSYRRTSTAYDDALGTLIVGGEDFVLGNTGFFAFSALGYLKNTRTCINSSTVEYQADWNGGYTEDTEYDYTNFVTSVVCTRYPTHNIPNLEDVTFDTLPRGIPERDIEDTFAELMELFVEIFNTWMFAGTHNYSNVNDRTYKFHTVPIKSSDGVHRYK